MLKPSLNVKNVHLKLTRNLQAHIKSIYEPSKKEKVQKEHKCIQCKKIFKVKKYLDHHVKINSSVRLTRGIRDLTEDKADLAF